MTAAYIATAAELDALCRRLAASPWLALDTEFIRERTYYPRLCLIQVAGADTLACIDPLALEDLSPLFRVLLDETILKVLHSAYQDLEVLLQAAGRVPCPVFDTQIAATLLGQGDQVGYAALVRTLTGVELDKSQVRTDWSRRPLEPEQLRYAAGDVLHLREVYRIQRAELERLGRLEWLAEDFSALCDPARYRVEPREAWRRIKGVQRLKGVQLNVLRALAAWREERAMEADRPRRWILADEVLLDLAQRMPADKARLERIRGLEGNTLKRHGATLLELIAGARQAPREQWPGLPAVAHLTPDQEALVDGAMALLRLCGQRHGVSPQTLAGRRDLEALVSGAGDLPLLHGWRAALAGGQVQDWLAGRLSLTVRDGALSVQSR